MTEQAEQLALIETGPKLTPKQTYALERVQHAREDGLSSDELGALLHEWRDGGHPAGERCRFCGRDGRSMALALAAKGLVRYRGRLKVWQAVTQPEAAPERPPDFQAGEAAVFGAFPEGY